MTPTLLLPLILLPAFLSLPAQASEAVYYRARQQPLAMVLRDMAEGFGLQAEIASSLTAVPVDGIFTPARAHDFFDEMAVRYQLDWHLDGQRVFITPRAARQQRRFVFSHAEGRDAFAAALQDGESGRGTVFPLTPGSGETAQPVLVLDAPPSFLLHADRIYRQYRSGRAIAVPGEVTEGVMVFPLRHAWAEDKTHQFANGSWTVPGVAGLLNQLIGGAPAAPSGATPAAVASPGLTPLPEISAAAPRKAKAAAARPGAPRVLPVILPDPRQNAVLVRDRRDKHAYYQTLIDRLDRPVQLIQIEAMIVDIAKNRISDLGINWRATDGRDSYGYGESPEEGDAAGSFGLALGTGEGARSLINDANTLMARIRVLATRGESRIVSRPSILTMDNLEAVINTSERFYVKVEGYQDSSLVPVESGTSLRVTPHLIPAAHPDGGVPQIRLLVAIEDGALDDSESARVDGLPRIQQHHVRTQAVIGQNESLLIGGHVHTIASRSRSYVPILGQIPVLGWLFRNERIIKREFIRLFIIRPHLHEDKMAGAAREAMPDGR